MIVEFVEYSGILIIALFGIWSALGYLGKRGIETQRYKLIKCMRGYEIRDYQPCIVAETMEVGNYSDSLTRGFRTVANYIFGNNTRNGQELVGSVSSGHETSANSIVDGSSEKIAMTAPVISERSNSDSAAGYRIAFVMPSKHTLGTLPSPRSGEIEIRSLERRLAAALTFSGYATEGKIVSKTEELRRMLARDGIRLVSSERVAQYDPPWTPPYMRRNEILIDIQE